MPGDSVPIYLQKRFDTKTSRLYSYAWIVYGFLYIPYQLKTVASIIQIAIPGLNITLAMLIGLTIAVIYTSFSGFWVVPLWGYFAACIASPVAWFFACFFLIPAYIVVRKRLQNEKQADAQQAARA